MDVARAVEIIGMLLALTGFLVGCIHFYKLQKGTATKLYQNIVAVCCGFAAMFVLTGSIVYHVLHDELKEINQFYLGVCYYFNHLSFVLFVITAILFWRYRIPRRDDQTVIIDSNSFDPSISVPVVHQYGYPMHHPTDLDVRGSGYVVHQPQNTAGPYMTMPNQPSMQPYITATGHGPDYGAPSTYNSSHIPQGRNGYAASKTQPPSNSQPRVTPPPYTED